MPTIKDVTLTLVPLTSNGFPNGHLILKWQADEDEITAYVTLRHMTFSGLTDQHESLQETILIKDH